MDVGDAQRPGNSLGRRPMIARQERHRLHPDRLQATDRLGAGRPHLVGDLDEPDRVLIADDPHHRGSGLRSTHRGLFERRIRLCIQPLTHAHSAPLNLGLGPDGDDLARAVDRGQRDLLVLGRSDDRLGQGVRRLCFDSSRDAQHLALVATRGRVGSTDRGLAHRQRARLVEGVHVRLGKDLQVRPALDEHAQSRRPRHCAEHRGRRTDRKRTRRAGDEERHRAVERVGPGEPPRKGRHDRKNGRDQQHRGHVIPLDFGCKELRG